MNNEPAVRGKDELEQNSAEHDIYTDPTISQSAKDPVAEFVKRQWKPLIFTILFVFALTYIVNSLKESAQRSLRSSADSFYKANNAFNEYKVSAKKVRDLELVAAPTVEAEKEKAQKELTDAKSDLTIKSDRLKEAVKVLSDAVEPYNKFTSIFNALAAHERGDLNAVKSALASYSTDSLAKLKDSERFIAELSLITLGRALIDSTESESEGKRILLALAKDGQTVAVSAAVSYARIANSEDEKKQAKELLESLALKFPEQASLLKQ
jgi:hypothetical protein